MRFLNTCISSIAAFRWSRWPFQKGYAAKLDRVQRKMIGSLLQIRPRPTEAYGDYVLRRQQYCGRQASTYGRWSHCWAKSVCDWNGHVLRNHDQQTWSHSLLHWHDSQWLDNMRLNASRSANESRTGTRATRSKVQRRWSEGVNEAKQVLRR